MSALRTVVYRRIVKPVIFKISPDAVHDYTMKLTHFAGGFPGAAPALRLVNTRRRPALETTWRGLHFSSPLGLSAGLDKNGQMVRIIHAIGFGFTTVGSVTAEYCAGNPKPWFYRLPKTQSLVVHAGLPNQGVRAILARLHRLPARLQRQYPIVLSVARTNSMNAAGCEEGIVDYVTSVTAAKHSPAISMIELNISCPNAYGGEAYTTPPLLEKLLSAVDAVKAPQPIIIKMPVDLPWAEFKKLLDVIVKHNIAGVTMANLTKRRDRVDFKEPLDDSIKGGLSGAPTRQLSTQLVRKTYEAYGDKLTIFGVGGVFTAEDAYEKIVNGASYVELVTGLILNGPGIAEEINAGLQKLLKRDGFTHISQAVGSAVIKKPKKASK